MPKSKTPAIITTWAAEMNDTEAEVRRYILSSLALFRGVAEKATTEAGFVAFKLGCTPRQAEVAIRWAEGEAPAETVATPEPIPAAEPDAAPIPEMQQRLMAAFPSLVAADFAYHATDLYVVAYPEVREWLKANHPHPKNVTSFISQAGSNWNGAGRACLDIPFAGVWPNDKKTDRY